MTRHLQSTWSVDVLPSTKQGIGLAALLCSIFLTTLVYRKGFSISRPKMCHFGMWILLSWRPLISFYCSLQGFKLGTLTIIRVITRNKFLWPIYRAGQTSNYWTLWSSCEWITFLPPLKPRSAGPHSWLRMPYMPHFPFLPKPLMYGRFPYVCM